MSKFSLFVLKVVQMPVNKDQVGYTLGGKERIVTPNGEILAVTITDNPESGLGYVPHCSTL